MNYVILQYITILAGAYNTGCTNSNELMAAPKNNQFWKQRSKHGRDKLFATPELLWEAACEYFEWSDKHPWKKNDFVGGGPKAGAKVSVDTSRPYTLSGLCLYCDASRDWWNKFRASASDDFLGVITRIEEIIYTQKFEGAAVGAFNASVIARDLGLVDKSETEAKIKLNGTLDYSKLSDEALEEIARLGTPQGEG